MKIEQIIILHLYKNRQVTLQGIGTFRVKDSITMPSEFDEKTIISGNAFSFEYNGNADQDIFLIDSIVQYTKKLRPLAEADLNSFLQWQKQLLNINMPFTLEHIGILQKTPQGQLNFTPLQLTVAGKSEKRSLHKSSPASNKNPKKLLPGILIIFGIGLISWIVYGFFANDRGGNKNIDQKTLLTSNNKAGLNKTDTTATTHMLSTSYEKSINDKNYVFKIVFLKTMVKTDALKTLDHIYGFGHSANIYSKDSVYEIAMPFNRPLSDTTHVKDSLNKYYSLGKGFVDFE